MDINGKLRETVINMMKDGLYELKPCPFCGGKTKMDSKQFFEELQEEYGRACISIRCEKCSLELRDHTSDEHDYYVRAFLVAEKWNRRAE